MYAYFKGTLESVTEDSIVVEVHGIGYHIFLSSSAMSYLPKIGENLKIYTYTCVREDAFLLYGFLATSDLDMFKKCITVSGIGPKVALGILSVMDADALRFAIISGDSKTIAKAPGIGPKTAGRLILELKDKVSADELLYKSDIQEDEIGLINTNINTTLQDAVDALVALGYSAGEALKAVKMVDNASEMDVETLLKTALKYMF